jgi:hypothetical protein
MYWIGVDPRASDKTETSKLWPSFAATGMQASRMSHTSTFQEKENIDWKKLIGILIRWRNGKKKEKEKIDPLAKYICLLSEKGQIHISPGEGAQPKPWKNAIFCPAEAKSWKDAFLFPLKRQQNIERWTPKRKRNGALFPPPPFSRIKNPSFCLLFVDVAIWLAFSLDFSWSMIVVNRHLAKEYKATAAISAYE